MAETQAAVATWTVDPAHSTAEFAIRHLMISTVRGRFSGISGQIVGDPNDWTGATAEIVIDAASVDTRQPDRDQHLRSADFFDVEKYPTITFKSTRIVKTGENRYEITGDLTIHGVTKSVTIQAESLGQSKDPWGGVRAGISAETRINRKDFGLHWNQVLETGGVLVGDEVRINVELELIRQSA